MKVDDMWIDVCKHPASGRLVYGCSEVNCAHVEGDSSKQSLAEVRECQDLSIADYS